MHELSIARNLVRLATDAAQSAGANRVKSVRVRLGALCGVMPEALEFCYDAVVEGTPLAGARLQIRVLPVVIYCPTCRQEAAVDNLQRLACPTCGTLSGELRQGQELELESIEVE